MRAPPAQPTSKSFQYGAGVAHAYQLDQQREAHLGVQLCATLRLLTVTFIPLIRRMLLGVATAGECGVGHMLKKLSFVTFASAMSLFASGCGTPVGACAAPVATNFTTPDGGIET